MNGKEGFGGHVVEIGRHYDELSSISNNAR